MTPETADDLLASCVAQRVLEYDSLSLCLAAIAGDLETMNAPNPVERDEAAARRWLAKITPTDLRLVITCRECECDPGLANADIERETLSAMWDTSTTDDPCPRCGGELIETV